MSFPGNQRYNDELSKAPMTVDILLHSRQRISDLSLKRVQQFKSEYFIPSRFIFFIFYFF